MRRRISRGDVLFFAARAERKMYSSRLRRRARRGEFAPDIKIMRSTLFIFMFGLKSLQHVRSTKLFRCVRCSLLLLQHNGDGTALWCGENGAERQICNSHRKTDLFLN